MTLWDLSLKDFRSELGSSAPTPGGGSTAAVCGSFGLGLVVMALEISRPRAAPGAEGGNVEASAGEGPDALLERARTLEQRIETHADRDVRVFEEYMRALKLPRATDEEREARAQAMAVAARVAAEAPIAAGRDLLAALELGLQACPLVKRSVASDVLGGADLLLGALSALLRNVDINLSALSDQSVREALRSDRHGLQTRAIAVHARICDALRPAAGG